MERLTSQLQLSKSLVSTLIAWASCIVHGKKCAPPEGNSSHLLQTLLSTKCPLEVPVSSTGYWESLTGDIHTSKSKGWVNETVNDNKLEKAWLQFAVFHAVTVLAHFRAPLWLGTSQCALTQCQEWVEGQHWSEAIPSQPSGCKSFAGGQGKKSFATYMWATKWHLAPEPPDCTCPILFTSINTDYTSKFYMSKAM